MKLSNAVIPVYWVVFAVAVAATALLDGPVAVVAVAGIVVGVAISLVVRFRGEDPEAELQRMLAGGDPHERG